MNNWSFRLVIMYQCIKVSGTRYQHVMQLGIIVNPSAFTRLQLSGFCDHWGQAAMGLNGSCGMKACVRILLLHSRIDGIPREMGFGGHLSGAVPIAGVGSFLELNFLQAIHKIPFETSSRCVKDHQAIHWGQNKHLLLPKTVKLNFASKAKPIDLGSNSIKIVKRVHTS